MMKPKFTDEHKYPRGYVPSGSTDIAKTWAAARRKLEQDRKQPEGQRAHAATAWRSQNMSLIKGNWSGDRLSGREALGD